MAALRNKVSELEQQLSSHWSDNTHQEWELCKKQILQVEKWDTDMLCHQAQMDWLKDGDRNSKFFHAVIKDKRKKQHIQIELPNGDVTTSAADIAARVQDFLVDLFSASPYHMEASLF